MKMMKSIATELIAPCGVNCFNCYAYLRHKNNCSGCRSDGINKPKHCINCSRNACVQGKGLKYCFECSKYPCIKIKNLHTTYKERYSIDLHRNGEIIRNKGVRAFLDIEREKWTCQTCGGVVCQHDSICSDCRNIAKSDSYCIK